MIGSAEDVIRSSEELRAAADKIFVQFPNLPEEVAKAQHGMIMDLIDALEEYRTLLLAYQQKIGRL